MFSKPKDKFGTVISCRFCESRNFDSNHHPNTCRTCFKCGIVGHNAKNCSQYSPSPWRYSKLDNTHLLSDREPVGLDVEKVRYGTNSLAGYVVVAQYPSRSKVRRINRDNVVYAAKIRRLRAEVSSYQTLYSGLSRIDLSEQAVPLDQVQEQLNKIFSDRLVVGIGLKDDLKSLGLYIPNTQTFDFLDHFLDESNQPIGLKALAYAFLGRKIQNFSPNYNPDRPHDAVVDAVSTIRIYKESFHYNNRRINSSYQWVRNIVDDAIGTGQIIPK